MVNSLHDAGLAPMAAIERLPKMLGITDPALQHALQKVAAAGRLGAKSAAQDVQEAIDSLQRWQVERGEAHKAGAAASMGALEGTLERRSRATLAPFYREPSLREQVLSGEFKVGGTD